MSLSFRPMSVLSMTAAAVFLSGCNLDLIEYGNRLEDADRMRQKVERMSPTAFAAMPTTGSAVFEGHGNLYIDRVRETQGDGLFAIGEATVTANFGTKTITGVINNMVGATNVRLDGANQVITRDVNSASVSGQILLGQEQSVIGNDAGTLTSRPNDWAMDYAGTVTFDGEAYTLDGAIDGQFYGTRVDNPRTDFPIKALAGGEPLYSGSTATRDSDGTVFDSNLVIIAENPID